VSVTSQTREAARAASATAPAPATWSQRLARALDRPLASYHLVLGVVALLLMLGLVMVFSASSVVAQEETDSSYSLFVTQAIFMAFGLPVVFIASRMSSRTWRRLAYPALLGSLFLLVLVQIPGIGVTVNGNRNWIDFGGPFRLQPSEAAKFALILFGADLLTRKRRLLGQWRHLLVPLLPIGGLLIGLILVGHDLGTAMILISVLLALLWVVGAPLRLFAAAVAGVAVIFVGFVATSPTRLARVTTFMDPFASLQGSGFQGGHSQLALATGGWWGLGLGASRQKWGTLPEAHTDFIFAIIGEELGLVGTLAVLTLFGLLAYAGLRIASRATDSFTTLAAAGITAWIAVQAVVNIGAVVGLLPITGIPLPLVSYGGSALLSTMLAVGMLLSFARREPGAAEALAAKRRGSLLGVFLPTRAR
jgi:cell division protein FtsW